jgi:GT2 family glycosyltransferase
MFLSVIIPTCNRYPMLKKCIAGLLPAVQGLGSDDYEIIVTDDSPADEQKQQLAVDFPGVRWNCGPRRGPASNRNSGARLGGGDWLLFVDDDCLPQSSLLAAYREALEKNPQMLVFEGATLPERAKERMDEDAPINKSGGYLWSCNFMIQRKLFFELGGFCEMFPNAAMEDVDLRERLKQKGHSFLFVSRAIVVHPWRRFPAPFKWFKMQLAVQWLYARLHSGRKGRPVRDTAFTIRAWIRDFLVYGPSLRFRGFPGWFVHCLTCILLALWIAVITGRVSKMENPAVSKDQ